MFSRHEKYYIQTGNLVVFLVMGYAWVCFSAAQISFIMTLGSYWFQYVNRVGSTPTLQSEDIQRDFLKWNAILKDFDKLISVRPKTQYICSVDVKRTEVEPAMSHIRSSLPLSKGVPCSNLPALTTPNCVVKTPDIDAEAIQECDLLSDVNLRPWTRKKGPEADVLLGKRYAHHFYFPVCMCSLQ